MSSVRVFSNPAPIPILNADRLSPAVEGCSNGEKRPLVMTLSQFWSYFLQYDHRVLKTAKALRQGERIYGVFTAADLLGEGAEVRLVEDDWKLLQEMVDEPLPVDMNGETKQGYSKPWIAHQCHTLINAITGALSEEAWLAARAPKGKESNGAREPVREVLRTEAPPSPVV